MAKHKKPPLVVVEWIDACDRGSLSGTIPDVIARAKLTKRETSGHFIYQDSERTVLAHDYDPPEAPDEEPEVGNTTTIPTGWIRRVRHIERGPRRRHEPTDSPRDGA